MVHINLVKVKITEYMYFKMKINKKKNNNNANTDKQITTSGSLLLCIHFNFLDTHFFGVKNSWLFRIHFYVVLSYTPIKTTEKLIFHSLK